MSKARKIAWFHFEEYINEEEVFTTAEAIIKIVELMRAWEGVKNDKITKMKTDKYGIVERFELEIEGINTEFLDERVLAIYEHGVVTCYLLD